MKNEVSDRVWILDDCLLRIQEGRATLEDCLQGHPDLAAELRSLLSTAGLVQSALVSQGPSPQYQKAAEARLRHRLQNLIVSGERRTAVRQISGGRHWARAAIAAMTIVLLVALSGGAITASAQSIPGDLLYPLKLELEQAQLTFSSTPEGDALLLSQFADKRLEEIQALIRAGRKGDLLLGLEEYSKTLGLLDDALQQMSSTDPARLEEIEARLALHSGVLTGLLDQVPASAREALGHALERFNHSQEEIKEIQQTGRPTNQVPGQQQQTRNPTNQVPGQQKKETIEPGNQGEKTERESPTKKPKNEPTNKLTKEPANTQKK